MRHAIVLAALAATAATAAGPAADPVARHAQLVAEGVTVVAALQKAEAAREAYDRAEAAGPAGAADIKKAVAALNAENIAHKTAAEAYAADVKAHNARCGSKAVKADAPTSFKKKEEQAAAKEAEKARVADCDAAGVALDARGDALDAKTAELLERHGTLEAQVAAGNASIDEQEKRGRELNADQAEAEDAADQWLERMNQVLDDRAFQAKAHGVEGCKARREMVLSGKDLKVFHTFMQTCAKNLKR